MTTTKRIEIEAVARALEAMGGDLFETVETQEAVEHVGPDSLGDDIYTCLGQTDTHPSTWAIRSTPERAEIVNFFQGAAIGSLLRALGWQEVQDSYVQSLAFYLP